MRCSARCSFGRSLHLRRWESGSTKHLTWFGTALPCQRAPFHPERKKLCEARARRTLMNKKVFIPILIAVVLVSIGARTWWSRGNDSLSASGTLESRNISVGSKVGGRIEKVLVAEGDRVQKDQVLVTFEDSELNARLLQAQGRYAQAKAVYAKLVNGSRPEDIAE